MPISKKSVRTKTYELRPEFFTGEMKVHRRIGCYYHRGIQCCVEGCHRKGTHVVHWYSESDFKKFGDIGTGEHVDIIGYEEDGTEYMMTVDHIVPSSKGGPKIWWNLQPMCEEHNNFQGNLRLYQPSLQWLKEIADHSKLKFVNDPSYQDLLEAVSEHYLKNPSEGSRLRNNVNKEKAKKKKKPKKNFVITKRKLNFTA